MNERDAGNGDSDVDTTLFHEESLVNIEIDGMIYTIPIAVNDLIDNLVLQIRELQTLSGSGGFKSN